MKNYSFCQEYLASEKMLELAWKCKKQEVTKKKMLLREAHNSAVNARNIYKEIKPNLKRRLTEADMRTIETSLMSLHSWTEQQKDADHVPVMIELWMRDKKMQPVLNKMM